VIRRLARPMLGAAFINSGWEALQGADRRAGRAESYGLSQPLTAIRVVAVTQIAGGVLLLINRMPRFTAALVALTVLPEATTGHDFWTEKDPDVKKSQRSLFVRDLGMLGGLLVAAVETGGRESVPHRAARTSRKAAKSAVEHVPSVGSA
jgi:putative oxidoreductase